MKYSVTGRLTVKDKEVTVERKFRKMRNVRNYLKSLREIGLECSELQGEKESWSTECRSRAGGGRLDVKRERVERSKGKEGKGD
ncbi:hypothetical protein GCM10007116_01890 [Sulfodiicoccus acidiphilus]|uniref:Uncharacterized protein n=1 Tax=Sulfodiicoccus acidiphilus TaxID=1670455 RepID=A0A830GY59_9CREN|nr:hypothetical protein GCM10007116_01890 [Sulfodiicoccus acidiphilus]